MEEHTSKEFDKLTKNLINLLKKIYTESLFIYEEWLPLINPEKYATPSESENKDKRYKWVLKNSKLSKIQIKKEIKKYKQPSELSVKEVQKIRERFGFSVYS